jgi:hypothetical protein
VHCTTIITHSQHSDEEDGTESVGSVDPQDHLSMDIEDEDEPILCVGKGKDSTSPDSDNDNDSTTDESGDKDP